MIAGLEEVIDMLPEHDAHTHHGAASPVGALERANRQLIALSHAATELGATRDRDAIVAAIPRLMTASLDFDRASLILERDDGVLGLASACWHGDPPELLERFMREVRADRVPAVPHVRRAFEERRTIVVPSPADDPQWPQHPIFVETGIVDQAIVFTPVAAGERTLGVLVANMRNTARGEHASDVAGDGTGAAGPRAPLGEQDIARVETFATLSGLALQNAELYGDMRLRLVQSEKIAAVGLIAAGVAHEINTPLGAIYSTQDTVRRAVAALASDEDEGCEPTRRQRLALAALGQASEVIRQGSEQVNAIVTRLRSFARLDEAEVKQVDVNASIDDAISLLSHEVGGDVAIERHYGELPPLRCYPRRLNQAFLNILVNALNAIAPPGTISVSTRVLGAASADGADADAASADADASAGVIEVRVRDTGVGIAPDHLARIFDPGFTTKGAGVGLGLSISHQVVTDHGGTIHVESTPGEGSTVTITLPVDAELLEHSARRRSTQAYAPVERGKK